ncbi:MAG TPA: sulfatase [Thermoplasmata archaeon]|nr:sulfatase [Thermoplasmata archaeon]
MPNLPRQAERPPNIVIVVMDCARAKSFGVDAGVARARTPVIDRLGRRGTVFPHAVAPANWTIPSHMSMFTGCYPNVHGLRTFRPGPPPRETLAAGLARRGYDTALFTEMVHLVAGYGLESGYARQFAAKFGLSDDDRTTSNRVASHLSVLYAPWVRTLIQKVPPTIVPLNFLNHPQEVAFKQEVCNGFVAHEFERWLGVRDPSKPFHAFFNVVDTHEPYPIIPNGHRLGPLAKWYARTPRYYLLAVPGLQDLVPWPELLAGYQWSVEQADAKVGRIVDALERSGELDRTLLIVTADHGQSFGEGGNVYHGCGATDSITRVPLVVSAPSGMSLPRTVERWTSLCDIFSWAKAAAAGRPAFGEDGRAPIPFAASAPPPETIFCEGAPASDPNRSLQGIGRRSSWNHRLLAAYRADGKYVLDLVTGAIAHWSPEVPDPDVVAPEVPTGREADEVRARVFGEYERIERARLVSAGPSETPTAELDGRLRSWGYD